MSLPSSAIRWFPIVAGCALVAAAGAAVIDPQVAGLRAVDLAAFGPPASPAGVTVLVGGAVVTYDGLELMGCDHAQGCAPLHTPPAPLVGVTLATSPAGDELWIGELAGTLTRLPLPVGSGPAVGVASVVGLGGLGFSPAGELLASLLDGSGVLSRVDRATGVIDEVFRDAAAVEPPAFAFLATGELLVEVVETPVRRLYLYSVVQVAGALGGATILTPAMGAAWSPTFPEITAAAAEGGGSVYVVDGLNREIWLGAGLTFTLVATGQPPLPGGSSFLSAVALPPGWPTLVPGGGASLAGLGVLSTRFDAGFQLADATLTVVHTTGAAGFLCGDADADEDVDVLDALLVAQAAAGLAEVTGLRFLQADVDGSGALAILDALHIARLVAGLPEVLACP